MEDKVTIIIAVVLGLIILAFFIALLIGLIITTGYEKDFLRNETVDSPNAHFVFNLKNGDILLFWTDTEYCAKDELGLRISTKNIKDWVSAEYRLRLYGRRKDVKRVAKAIINEQGYTEYIDRRMYYHQPGIISDVIILGRGDKRWLISITVKNPKFESRRLIDASKLCRK